MYQRKVLLSHAHAHALDRAVELARDTLPATHEGDPPSVAAERLAGSGANHIRLGLAAVPKEDQGTEVQPLPALASTVEFASRAWESWSGGAAARSSIVSHYSADFEDEWGGVWSCILPHVRDTRSAHQKVPWAKPSSHLKPGKELYPLHKMSPYLCLSQRGLRYMPGPFMIPSRPLSRRAEGLGCQEPHIVTNKQQLLPSQARFPTSLTSLVLLIAVDGSLVPQPPESSALVTLSRATWRLS